MTTNLDYGGNEQCTAMKRANFDAIFNFYISINFK